MPAHILQNSSYRMVAASFRATLLAGVNFWLESPQPQAHELPWWILKIAQRAYILPALSLLHLNLCICVQLPFFAVSSGISKAPASSLQSTVPPNYTASSTTSFPIRQSLKNNPQLRHFAAILYPELSPASSTPGVTSCRPSL
jgi:hypothetical protein